MISGQEQPDEGQVALDRGITIGYFSQDVGEMSGRSAVAEVMDGAGPVSLVAAELKELEAAMADPDRADDMEESSRATARCRGVSRNSTATRWTAGRARRCRASASARR
jgi:ATPase components of ABC transporters with duplicated ATPase domains